MSNMSYCQFENTNRDLQECLKALEKRDVSSNSERRSAHRMLKSVCKFLAGEGIIEDYDISVIDDIIEECMEEKENED